MSRFAAFINAGGILVYESAPENLLIGVLAIVAIVLGAGDVRLHRGGLAGVSAAFDAVALVVVGPVLSAALVVLGVLAGVGFGDATRNAGTRLLTARIIGLLLGYFAALLSAASTAIPLAAVRGTAMLVSFFAAVGVYLLLGDDGGAAPSVLTRRRGMEGQTSMAMAQLSAGCLALTVFETMAAWSLILLCVLLLLVRQSYALLAEISDSYLRTVEVLVEAAEGIGSTLSGHADRSATLARSLASRSGLSSSAVQCAGYAALLHAVGAIGDGAGTSSGRAGVGAAKVVENIGFFAPVLRPLRLLDSLSDSAEVSQEDVSIALCVALAQRRDISSIVGSRGDWLLTGDVRRISTLADPATLRRVRKAATALGYDDQGALY